MLVRGRGLEDVQGAGLPSGFEARDYSEARTGKGVETGQGVETGFPKVLGVGNLRSDQ